nr:hypothetical protein Iba_chr03bCG2610 [Ipomoea batatas]
MGGGGMSATIAAEFSGGFRWQASWGLIASSMSLFSGGSVIAAPQGKHHRCWLTQTVRAQASAQAPICYRLVQITDTREGKLDAGLFESMDHGGAVVDKLHGKDVQIRGGAWRPRLEKIIDKQIGAEIFEKLREAQAGFVDGLLENRHEVRRSPLVP